MKKIKLDVVTLIDPDSFFAEQYRTIRTNIEFLMDKDNLKSILLTSANSGEGKTTTILNLAVIFAKAGKKVLLIDGDLRKQSLTTNFNVHNARGFIELLQGGKNLNDGIYDTTVEQLFFLPSGMPVTNPAEVLLNNHFESFLEELKQNFDLILFDTPPIEEVADTLIISQKLDGCVLVVRENYSKKDAVKRTKEALDDIGATCLGIIHNDVSITKNKNEYYGYPYGKRSRLTNKQKKIFRVLRNKKN
ncbi:CpsD/CapB family tyrosine-protein kinase [Enterococcus faecalis]|uniref:CpsD/CapB family tyrosine-protein kinase n=1 Tax=Enterococcus faecalis TaxID=1351 RepID=UPI00115D373A|nr:CpsD/CapB family tyrosine-protein kinase [Enterococcus faecalis]EGO5829954.1 CpsD/CapB family tyrosine-protein kinase [Enterococcus faecalis]EGO6036420.1 CpsD/CapB family tyrosine-protein kinase [Enterococcus faecalis]EHU9649692.1 CpsD/CapB family tyrosine-protein kinase [Enterococcus faecalis]EHU9677021.1 CpsD/CapB family tyrosine-protein kinase [Enterococcus faecalis]EIA6407697.1 CpsD/CapB family tyrosine-protein kinase [Enterococcus faecalis]